MAGFDFSRVASLNAFCRFIGQPTVALLIAVRLAAYLTGDPYGNTVGYKVNEVDAVGNEDYLDRNSDTFQVSGISIAYF